MPSPTGPQGLARQTLAALRTNRPLGGLGRALRGGRGLVSIHIPKCGGTSVERGLRRAYPLGRRLIGPEASYEAARTLLGLGDAEDDRHRALMRASEMRRDLLHYHLAEGATLVTGHAPLGPHTAEAYGASHAFVTVMRSPGERMLSHLAFNKTEQAGHGRSELSVAQFLETPRAQVLGALYVKYLAGLPMSADFTTQAAIDAARRTVDRLDLVGFTDEMDAFAEGLEALTGRRFAFGHANRGTGARLPEAAADRARSLCAPDEAVYAHARERFGERRAEAR